MWWKWRTYLDEAAGVAGNPSSPHAEGRAAKGRLERARTTIARLLEVQADDIVFTSGATEANALAILGHVRALRAAAGPDVPGRNNLHVLYLPSAHASIVENMKLLAEEGVAVEPLPIKDYRVDTEALKKMIRKETVLVSMDAVCGETGVVWNTREVAETLKKAHGGAEHFSAPSGPGSAFGQPVAGKMSRPAVLHIDASQAPLTEKVTRAHFGADLLTFDLGKISPERGLGVLVAHRTTPLTPLFRGGPQERGLRPGSESVALAESFADALLAAVLGRDAFRMSAALTRFRFLSRITGVIPNLFVQEAPDEKRQAPNIINLSVVGRDTDYLVALLDNAGFAVSTRSACETDSESGSRAVLALTGDPERARSTLRISWGPGVRAFSLVHLAVLLRREIAFVDKHAAG